MDIDRYKIMHQKTNRKNFKLENTQITDGVLYSSGVASTTFEYYSIYLGTNDISPMTINVVFEKEGLALYMGDIEQKKSILSIPSTG